MPSNEAGTVAAIWKAIHREYPKAWRFKVVGSPYQMSGVPDLLLCVEGLLVGLEVKYQRPGESVEHALSRVTPRQWQQIREINQAGGYAAVVLNPAGALAAIGEALDGRRPPGNTGGDGERG